MGVCSSCLDKPFRMPSCFARNNYARPIQTTWLSRIDLVKTLVCLLRFMRYLLEWGILSTYFSISGAHRTNSCFQNLKIGFLINSMNVTNRPHGCGRMIINRSTKTLVICS
jgi:hypothetical protein